MTRILSLGAGVQSTTLALMAAKGEIPSPDCAIFADTGWEPKAVYDHLERLTAVLPFPVFTVSAGNLRQTTLNRSKSPASRVAAIPWFMKMPDGSPSMGRRQCTKEYKIYPIRRKVRELLGGKTPRGGCEMLIGISTDEAHRMKASTVQYIINIFPLIEKEMSRAACVRWMEKVGWVAPKSSCIGCPYHSDDQWRALAPDEFSDAITIDRAIRHQAGFRGEQFMHRSLKPLDEVDLSTWAERGQPDLFGEECEGMCGV
jgi:hypothetical protein